MKKFNVKALPAAAFLLCLLALFVVGVRTFLVSAYVESDYFHHFSSATFQKTEEEFNNSLATRNIFIDINSFFDRITGKRMKKDYVRLNNDNLAYLVKEQDETSYADATIRLNDYVTKTLNKPFLFVMFPFSVNPNDKQLPPGFEDYGNENADAFLAQLDANGVKTYDFRDSFTPRADYYELFYRTDHHWKAETGFIAAQELFRYLAARDASFAVDERVTDEHNYTVKTYDNFLGSLGRSFGRYYCGYEAFSAISPSFDVSLSAYDFNGRLLHRGGAENTVLFPARLTYETHYFCEMYSYYMDGDHGYRRLVNQTDGLKVAPKKILVIKDSYANAMLPYLVYAYSEVTVVDLRDLTAPLTDVIRQADPDLTVVAYHPGSLRDNSAGFFRFFDQ